MPEEEVTSTNLPGMVVSEERSAWPASKVSITKTGISARREPMETAV